MDGLRGDPETSEDRNLAWLARIDHQYFGTRRLRRALVTIVAAASVFSWAASLSPSLAQLLHAGAAVWGAFVVIAACTSLQEWRLCRARRRCIDSLAAETRDRLG